MSASLTYQGTGTVPRDETHIVFAQTMGYVAVTAALFAAGAAPCGRPGPRRARSARWAVSSRATGSRW